MSDIIGKRKNTSLKVVFLLPSCNASHENYLREMNYQCQIELLQQQIKLQESNYNYAVERGKGINIQICLREHIKKLKEDLLRLQTATAGLYFNSPMLIGEEFWRNN